MPFAVFGKNRKMLRSQRWRIQKIHGFKVFAYTMSREHLQKTHSACKCFGLFACSARMYSHYLQVFAHFVVSRENGWKLSSQLPSTCLPWPLVISRSPIKIVRWKNLCAGVSSIELTPSCSNTPLKVAKPVSPSSLNLSCILMITERRLKHYVWISQELCSYLTW